MKGVVFTEFLGFVSQQFGDDMVDDIIDASELPSGGSYTSVGTYSHAEMGALCKALATQSGQPAGDLVRAFGSHLSGSFAAGHPAFFERSGSFFDFLESIEGHIHVEVRKLYPDAELPHFAVAERSPTRLVLDYSSPRRMGHLAEGLIVGSARQFGVQAQVCSQDIPGTDGQGVRFVIDITPAPRATATGCPRQLEDA